MPERYCDAWGRVPCTGPGALCSPDLIGRLIRKANPVQGLASQLRRRPHLAMMILACPVAELIARRGPYFAIAS